jgi:hypothetical protein
LLKTDAGTSAIRILELKKENVQGSVTQTGFANRS